jgi:hypothetical protein
MKITLLCGPESKLICYVQVSLTVIGIERFVEELVTV